MRRAIFLLLLFITASSFSQDSTSGTIHVRRNTDTINCHDYSLTQQFYYDWGRWPMDSVKLKGKTLFAGTQRTNFDTLLIAYRRLNGVPIGRCLTVSPNGHLREELVLDSNIQREIDWISYDGGPAWPDTSYHANRISYKRYYKNDNLMQEIRYKDGKSVATYNYYLSGRIEDSTVYDGKVTRTKHFSCSGRVTMNIGNMRDDVKQVHTEYDDEDRIKKVDTYFFMKSYTRTDLYDKNGKIVSSKTSKL